MGISKLVPSGSTNGMPVKVAAVATAGTLFHTAVSGTAALDEITMYLTNIDSVDHVATLEFGDATAPDHNIKITVPAKDTVLAIPGVPLNNAKTVKVFADTANVLNMFGFVNQIS